MQLVAGFRAAPGSCATCGTPSAGPGVVDLEVEDPGVLNRRHRVYLCSDCALQVGSMVGGLKGRTIVPTETYSALEARARNADHWEAEVQRMREILTSAQSQLAPFAGEVAS